MTMDSEAINVADNEGHKRRRGEYKKYLYDTEFSVPRTTQWNHLKTSERASAG